MKLRKWLIDIRGNISIDEVVKRTGISIVTYRKLENTNILPRKKNADKIAEFFGFDWMLFYPDSYPPRRIVEGKLKYEILGEITIIFVKSKKQIHKVLVDTDQLEKIIKLNRTITLIWSHNNTPYARFNKVPSNKHRTLHRFLTDCPDGYEVDHIHHNTLDNRLSQLRIVTTAQNRQNQNGARIDNKIGKRGITWDKRSKKWKITVVINKKLVFCEFNRDIEEAERIAKIARTKYMKFCSEGGHIKLSLEDEKIFETNRARSNNKSCGIRNVTWDKKAKRWVFVKYIGSKRIRFKGMKDLVTASKVAEMVRSLEEFHKENGDRYQIIKEEVQKLLKAS